MHHIGAAQEANLRQSFSGKFGYYNPGEGLNDGLLLGVDGITEFVRHDFFLSGAVDVYFKQTFDFFNAPKPDVTSQSIVLLPLHANFGYKVVDFSTADTRVYAGLGGGYYLFFYTVDYRSSSGGIIGSVIAKSESKSGGNAFASFFVRALIGKIFIEPRYYLASKKESSIETHTFVVDPSGFAITLGFQY
jgi:hypothetical protein